MENTDRQNRFYTRSFTTFLIVGTFLVLLLSGFILYVAPKGRVANWTGWAVVGIDKEQWGGIHINMALLFLGVSALHLFYNWKVLVNYLHSRKERQFRRGKELLAAVVVVGVFGVGTVAEWMPFHSVIVLHEDIKAYWDANTQAAPVAHAEDLTLKDFAQYVGMTGRDAVEKLKGAGIQVDNAQLKMGDIAHQNALKPVDLYRILAPKGTPKVMSVNPDGTMPKGGYGQMTVADLALVSKQETGALLAKLQAKGYQAEGSANLRTVASALGVSPGSLASELTGLETGH